MVVNPLIRCQSATVRHEGRGDPSGTRACLGSYEFVAWTGRGLEGGTFVGLSVE